MKKGILILLAVIFIFGGCSTTPTKTEKGAGYGAAGGAIAGALAGQLIGGDTEATLLGAAAGAAIGGAAGAGVGHMMDKQEQEMRQALAESEAAAVRREGNLLAIVLKGDVTFDFNSAKVNPGLYREIDRIAGVMIEYPRTNILVEGHTDSKGSEAYNMELSRRRAESVRDLLVEKGVSGTRISTTGHGESMPVATNDTPEGRQQNRRVEIKINPDSVQ